MMTTIEHRLQEKMIELADRMTDRIFGDHPELLKRYGPEGRKRCHEDSVFHIKYLAEALKMDFPDMYVNYIQWARSMLSTRDIPAEDLDMSMKYLQEAVTSIMGKEDGERVNEYIEKARTKLGEVETLKNLKTYITDDNPLKDELVQYLDFLLNGQRQEATELIERLVDGGTPIVDIYEHIFQASQYEVGLLWQCNRITVAHEHYCTAATQLIVSRLYPKIFSTKKKGKTIIACTMTGELHELGIRMVSDFFEMDGWDTYYLGANMPERNLKDALIEHKADVLAISVTLPIHTGRSADLIGSIRNEKVFDGLMILVGGYPFLMNPGLWEKVKADGFASTAREAIAVANQLVGEA